MDDEARIRIWRLAVVGAVLVAFIGGATILLTSEHGAPAAESNAQIQILGSVVKGCDTLPTSARVVMPHHGGWCQRSHKPD